MRYPFATTQKIRTKAEFSLLFEDGIKTTRGPLVLRVRANGLGHSRLGLAVPRAVGTAVRRNRIKRLLRESFRLLQHELPQGLDMVMVVRPHVPLGLDDYQQSLRMMTEKLKVA